MKNNDADAGGSLPRSEPSLNADRLSNDQRFSGDNSANKAHDVKVYLDTMSEVIYTELKQIAAAQMRREQPGHTLSPTSLVHEAYIKLQAVGVFATIQDESHTKALITRVMQRLLIDHFRARRAREARNNNHVKNAEPELMFSIQDANITSAITELANIDPRAADIMHLRYYSGLTLVQIAMCLGVSLSTIEKESRHASAWLKVRLKDKL